MATKLVFIKNRLVKKMPSPKNLQSLPILSFIIFIFAASSFLLASPSRSWAAPGDKEEPGGNVSGQYLIGAGDILEIAVWNEPNLNKTTLVRLDGRISLPLIGEALASGLSLEALASFLKNKFSRFLADPNVAVILKESRSKRYYIIGQIKTPGEFAIDQPITVLQAIARAGGFMEWAKTSKILIIRKKADQDQIYKFNYDSVIKGNDLDQNITISPGDTLVIP